MSEVEISYGVTSEDIEVVSSNAREPERVDFERHFDTVAEGVLASCLASKEVRTAYIDGEPIAIFGLTDLVDDGYRSPWLLLSESATQRPFAVARHARRIVRGWAEKHGGTLANIVPVEDGPAIDLLRFCGFEIHAPIEVNGFAYHPFQIDTGV